MKFDKKAVLDMLEMEGVEYEAAEHEAAYTLDEMLEMGLPHAESIAKNLFIRDDKKRNYYLITVKDGKRADLKKIRKFLNERPLKFASEEELMKYTGLSKGEVTPFGVLNDDGGYVKVFIDEDYRGGLIGVHPNDNTVTVWIETEILMDIIKKQGNKAEYIHIEDISTDIS